MVEEIKHFSYHFILYTYAQLSLPSGNSGCSIAKPRPMYLGFERALTVEL